MKALVLTAGRGVRLRPLTSTRSKSMLMVAGRPVLDYIFESLRENDIRDVVLVVGHGREQILDYLRDKEESEFHVRYVLQHEQKGVEHAILTARSEIEDQDEFLLVNGDVLVEPEMVRRTVQHHAIAGSEMTMLVTLVSNPGQFGAVRMNRDGFVEELVEKAPPNTYVSNYVVAGVSVFRREILDLLEKHHTMERTLGTLIESGGKVAATVWEQEWTEFTWPWDVLRANKVALDKMLSGRGSFIAESADIRSNVVIEGSVYIGEDSIVRSGTTLRGPVYIGRGVHVGSNSLVRDYACLCDGVTLGYSVEVRNSVIYERVRIGRMTYVADSIIGADSCIEAGVQMWNWRPGDQKLYINEDDGPVEVPLSKFGAMVGDGVIIGVNSSLYPAIRIGERSIISPGCVIDRDIPPGSDVSVKQELLIRSRDGLSRHGCG
ncbi:MAG: NDP-sugar synthase [Candidatus Thorarchaeota archaeon]